jgi:hypothetical protein
MKVRIDPAICALACPIGAITAEKATPCCGGFGW